MLLVMIAAYHGKHTTFFTAPLVDFWADDTPTKCLGMVDPALIVDGYGVTVL